MTDLLIVANELHAANLSAKARFVEKMEVGQAEYFMRYPVQEGSQPMSSVTNERKMNVGRLRIVEYKGKREYHLINRATVYLRIDGTDWVAYQPIKDKMPNIEDLPADINDDHDLPDGHMWEVEYIECPAKKRMAGYEYDKIVRIHVLPEVGLPYPTEDSFNGDHQAWMVECNRIQKINEKAKRLKDTKPVETAPSSPVAAPIENEPTEYTGPRDWSIFKLVDDIFTKIATDPMVYSVVGHWEKDMTAITGMKYDHTEHQKHIKLIRATIIRDGLFATTKGLDAICIKRASDQQHDATIETVTETIEPITEDKPVTNQHYDTPEMIEEQTEITVDDARKLAGELFAAVWTDKDVRTEKWMAFFGRGKTAFKDWFDKGGNRLQIENYLAGVKEMNDHFNNTPHPDLTSKPEFDEPEKISPMAETHRAPSTVRQSPPVQHPPIATSPRQTPPTENPFKPAEFVGCYLKMAIDGPSKCGKSFSALKIATSLWDGVKVAGLDTERRSMRKYAKEFKFDVLELATFHPDSYIRAINSAVKFGYDVLVIDSLSHAWNGNGGILSLVDAKGGKFSDWKDVNPILWKLIEVILDADIHIISTMRVKTEYVMETYEVNGRTKTAPKKVGLSPTMKEGIAYEFDIVADMDMEHNLTVDSSRCPNMNGKTFNNPGADVSAILSAWIRGE